MTDWSDDPELLATFQAEVSERLASLQAGLLQLEGHPSPRQLIGGLFRDAHTVKGSARMLGLAPVLQVAHAAEDVLAGLRDGRLAVTPQVVEVLLRAGDCVAANMPGAGEAADELTVDRVVPALAAVLSGQPAAEARAAEAPAAKPPPAGPPLPAVPAPRDHQAATPPEPTPPEPTPPEPTWAGPTPAAADSIRVTATKVYDLLDTVGEAELGARRLQQTTDELRRFCAAHARATVALRGASARADLTLPPAVKSALLHVSEAAEEITAVATTLREVAETHSGRVMDVRDGAMALAMVPVRRVFAALPRLVRDVTAQSGKQVVLELAGGEVELDKHVLDGLADALKHLVTNAIDHGCEPPAQRLATGKPATAVIQVMASASGGTVTIEVSDDGRGIDETAVRTAAIARGLLPPDSAATGPALLGLLFTPALSTAATVTETSGRGVGLDVVRTAMEQLGGRADVRTVLGAGCRFTLTLPVTLGVLRCLIARVGRERYAVPVAGITETVSLRDAAVHTLAGSRVLGWHGTTVPLVDLASVLDVPTAGKPRVAVVVRYGDRQLGWGVDALEGEGQLVVKNLGGFIGPVPAVPGATIDADGTVVCLLDLRELADRATDSTGHREVERSGDPDDGRATATTAATSRPRILVVEDSIGVRELERVILEGAGYAVETAVDGLDGASRLGPEPADLVLSDVEMPGMDGFALTRTIRRTGGWEQVPVVIMTSRGADTDRHAGLESGANAYLLKSEFDQAELVGTVRRLVGR